MSAYNVLAKPEVPRKPLDAGFPLMSELHGQGLDALRKDAAYRVGWRRGLAERTAEAVKDGETAEGIRDRIIAAPDDKTALAMAREVNLAEVARCEEELKPHEAAIRHLDRVCAAYRDAKAWLTGPVVLGAATASSLHKIGTDNVLCMRMEVDFRPPEIIAAQEGQTGVFLIQHDWASLLATADVDAGAYRLPFDLCCFEFVVSGRHVCALVASHEGEPYRMVPLIRARGGWLIMNSYAINGGEMTPEFAAGLADKADPPPPELADLIMAQVRAVAITLDAEVVTRDVVRAPHRLNVARIKRGERPIYDHHVLTLNRRPRPAPLAEPGHSGGRRRLHFRRGHWRHYPNHKTWIKWMLVGDPELGFADKDYRL